MLLESTKISKGFFLFSLWIQGTLRGFYDFGMENNDLPSFILPLDQEGPKNMGCILKGELRPKNHKAQVKNKL